MAIYVDVGIAVLTKAEVTLLSYVEWASRPCLFPALKLNVEKQIDLQS